MIYERHRRGASGLEPLTTWVMFPKSKARSLKPPPLLVVVVTRFTNTHYKGKGQCKFVHQHTIY